MILMTATAGVIAPTPDPRPVVADPVVMAMRPAAKPLATITLAADGTGDHTTVQAAITAGLAIQDGARAAAGLAPWQITPNFRVDYLVKPGVYGDPVTDAIPPFSAFYATGAKGTTIVHPGLEPAAGFYWEGIDVNNDQDVALDPKYAFHMHAGRGAIIITRCTLSNPSTTAGGRPTPVGMDGMPSAMLVMHDIDFTTGVGLNNHGGSTHDTDPGMTIVYSQCRFPGGSLSFNTMTDPDPTEMWVIGGAADTVTLQGDKSVLHLDPATVLDRTASHTKQNGTPATGGTDSRTDWPVPTGGLSATDRAYYGM